MTGITRFRPHQVHRRLPGCAHCGEPIRAGTRRARLFCDRPGCRQAASRERRRLVTESDHGPQYRPPKNNERTGSGAKLGVRKSLKLLRPCHSKIGTSINLIGGERTGSLDLQTVAKIFATELGVPTGTVTSTDNVATTITPMTWGRR